MFNQESARPWSRRSVLAGVGAVCGAALVRSNGGLLADESDAKAQPPLRREDFYDAQGTFLVDKARKAYFEMLRKIHYPITPAVEKNVWIADFQLGDFPRVGMGGVVWVNRPDYDYFGLDIFLLPGQMIPEHRHAPTEKAKAKMESWQIRSGMVFTFGEGESTPSLLDHIPESQRPSVKSHHGTALHLHEVGHLNRTDAWHFMIAGPEGAWVTEYGMFQDMGALRFSNPKGGV